MITIVDYGVGNIGAMLNMFDFLGIDAQASSDPTEIERATKLVLPGVGAFGKAMAELQRRHLTAPLDHAVRVRRTPILGVCLGMQLLARRSDESNVAGLGWIPADVRKIMPADPTLKVPHIGWSEVSPRTSDSLFEKTATLDRFYFVHSYHVDCDDAADVLATVEYGETLCCAVHRDNVYGVQFHPEKSHKFGMKLLRAFASLPTP